MAEYEATKTLPAMPDLSAWERAAWRARDENASPREARRRIAEKTEVSGEAEELGRRSRSGSSDQVSMSTLMPKQKKLQKGLATGKGGRAQVLLGVSLRS